MLLTVPFLLCTMFACINKQTITDEEFIVPETQKIADSVFRQIDDFPNIKDSTSFISDLQLFATLEIDESPTQGENHLISSYKKVKIYGSDKDYIFIEYDYKNGCGAAFPWKYQVLLTERGKLVKTLSALRYEFVEIIKNENPFLLTLTSSSKGNGGHQIYKMTADTLENVCKGNLNNWVQTYDAHEDIAVFEPNELKIEFKDENKDGFNDLVFRGEKLMLGKFSKEGFFNEVESGKPFTVENPASRIALKYVFLYDKLTGHFIPKEKYE